MKLGNINALDIGESDIKVIRGGIDPKGWGIIFNSLFNYSRPIESLVREIASNCFDSHREAALVPSFGEKDFFDAGYRPESWTEDKEEVFGSCSPEEKAALAKELKEEYERVKAHFSFWQERPVEVEMVKENPLTGSESAIIFRDFGVGLSPWRVRMIYPMLTASTKRWTNEMLGGFGRGSKSSLGYRNDFFVVTRYFGLKYYYVVRRAEAGMDIDFMGSEPTGEVNGTEVVVGIKEGDWNAFQKAVKEQLAYFPEIDYRGCGVQPGIVYRGKHFVFRTNTPFENRLHLSIEGVYYPLDYAAMGFASYNYSYLNNIEYALPLALRFSLDEIGFAIMETRENIQYTAEVKQLILDRIEDVKRELLEIRDASYGDITTIDAYLSAIQSLGVTGGLRIADEGVTLPFASQMIPVEVVYPKYRELKRLPRDPFLCWERYRRIEKKGEEVHIDQSFRRTDMSKLLMNPSASVYLAPSEKMSWKKNRFISMKQGGFWVIREKPWRGAPLAEDIKSAFGYAWHQTTLSSEEEDLMKAFLEEASDYVRRKFPSYDSVEPDEAFEETLREEREDAKLLVKAEKKRKSAYFNVYELTFEDNYTFSSSVSFKSNTWKIGEAEAYRGVVVYGHQEDRDLLMKLGGILFSNQELILKKNYEGVYSFNPKRIRVFWMNKQSAKHFASNPNAVHVTEFVKSRHRLLIRWVTAQRLEKLLEELPGWNSVVSQTGDTVAHEAFRKAQRLDAYRGKYYNLAPFSALRRYMLEGVQEEFKSIIEDLGLVEEDVMQDFEWLRAFYEKYPLLRNVNLNYVDLPEEIEVYMEAKGPVNPLLLRRFKAHKVQKLQRDPLTSYSGDGHATAELVLSEVDASV